MVKSHQNTHNSVKYEVLIKQYLRSIPDIGAQNQVRDQIEAQKHKETVYNINIVFW